MMKRAACLALLAVLFSAPAQAQPARNWTPDNGNGNGTFTNLLFYDEFSDPDLIHMIICGLSRELWPLPPAWW